MPSCQAPVNVVYPDGRRVRIACTLPKPNHGAMHSHTYTPGGAAMGTPWIVCYYWRKGISEVVLAQGATLDPSLPAAN